MKSIRTSLMACLVIMALLAGSVFCADQEDTFDNLPVKGMVTMIDLGAKKCVPCKMMAPIMEKVEKDYKGKAVISFIDVWEYKAPVKRFGIKAIPTQIFFDENQKEVFRHVGFFSEKQIVEQLTRMGVEPPDTIDKG